MIANVCTVPRGTAFHKARIASNIENDLFPVDSYSSKVDKLTTVVHKQCA